MKTPLQLRLSQIKQKDADKYKMDLKDLKALYTKRYLKVATDAKKNKGKFTPPTIDEAVNPPKETVAAQPAAAPLLPPEKVEGTKTVNLVDGTIYTITRNADKKIVVTAAGEARTVKFGTEILDVFMRKPSATDKGGIDLKLIDNKTVTLDPIALRDAVQNKRTELFAIDGITKIELLPTQTNS